MEWIVFAAVGVGVVLFGIVGQRLGWADFSNKNAKRRSGGSGSYMSIGDEVFHPAKFESQLELDRQTILPAPAPVPGDGDKDIFRGNVKIDLTHNRPRGRHRA